MSQDEVFAEHARKLIHTATMAFNEAKSYISGIQDETLKRKVERDMSELVHEVESWWTR